MIYSTFELCRHEPAVKSVSTADWKDAGLSQSSGPRCQLGQVEAQVEATEDALSASGMRDGSGQTGVGDAEDTARTETGCGDQQPVGGVGAIRGANSPLSWFGVLVPPTLREAQSSFRQGGVSCRGDITASVLPPPSSHSLTQLWKSPYSWRIMPRA